MERLNATTSLVTDAEDSKLLIGIVLLFVNFLARWIFLLHDLVVVGVLVEVSALGDDPDLTFVQVGLSNLDLFSPCFVGAHFVEDESSN